MSRQTIVLKGDLGTRHEEFVASGIFKPGHLLQLDSNNKVLKHATAGGVARLVAKEDALQGKTVTDAYAVGDVVPCHMWQKQDKLQLRLPAAAGAVAIGDRLISNGDGCVVKGSGVSAVVYSNTAASAAITASSAEALFDKSYTLPAGALKAGDVIKIRAQVIATATNSTDTLTVKLYIGGLAGTSICSSGALDVANNDICVIDATLVVRTIGATGTFVAAGFITIGVPGTSTVKAFNLGSTTIDTTASQVIGVSGKWSTTDVGNSARLDELVVEQTIAASDGETVGLAAEAVDNSLGADEAFIAAWAA